MLYEEDENYRDAWKKLKDNVPETKYFQLINNREYAYLEIELLVDRFRDYLQEVTGFHDLQEYLFGQGNVHVYATRNVYPVPNDCEYMIDYDSEE